MVRASLSGQHWVGNLAWSSQYWVGDSAWSGQYWVEDSAWSGQYWEDSAQSGIGGTQSGVVSMERQPGMRSNHNSNFPSLQAH